MTARVSLVIPSHRRGAKIGPTLSSVLAQTRPPDEVVVVNDGGFAETREFVAAHFPTVRVVDAVCGSAGAARNHGARSAVHPLVVFLDDDDLLHPHAVDTLLRTFYTFPNAKAAYADHTFTDRATGTHYPSHRGGPTFRRLRAIRPVRTTGGVRLFDRRLYYQMLWGGLLQQPWLVDRAVFLALGGFDESVRSNEDWELYLRVVYSHRVALTDTVISDHIAEAGRAHVSRSADLAETSARLVRKHLKLRARSLDVRAVPVLLRRLAQHHKATGDQLLTTDRRAAWRAYLRAFAVWPLDHVVAARALVLWPLKLLAGGRAPRREERP